MVKDATCQFHKKCKLRRSCEGCQIPLVAGEYEHEHATKLNYAKDTDFRGLVEIKELYGELANRPSPMDWIPLSEWEDFNAEFAEEEKAFD